MLNPLQMIKHNKKLNNKYTTHIILLSIHLSIIMSEPNEYEHTKESQLTAAIDNITKFTEIMVTMSRENANLKNLVSEMDEMKKLVWTQQELEQQKHEFLQQRQEFERQKHEFLQQRQELEQQRRELEQQIQTTNKLNIVLNEKKCNMDEQQQRINEQKQILIKQKQHVDEQQKNVDQQKRHVDRQKQILDQIMQEFNLSCTKN